MRGSDGVVYLDHNSTTPLAPEVVDAITDSLVHNWANPSSDSEPGRQARSLIEAARADVAAMVKATNPLDIVFTSGGTESNNCAILSAVEYGRQRNITPHVILSNVEHVATTAPIKRLASQGLIEYTEVPVNKQGLLEVHDVIEKIRPDTVLVTVMMANNETGVIFPIPEIGRSLEIVNEKRENHVWFHVDAAQAIGKISVYVQELGVDFLTIVGHKFYGPRVGALYVRDRAVVCPLVSGGGQEHGLRPGTENTPMIIGLGRAAKLVSENLQRYASVMMNARDYLIHQLIKSKSGCVMNCSSSPRLPNTVSVSWPQCGLSGHELLARCPLLCASTTAACHDQAQLSEVLLRSGVSADVALSTIRLSVGRTTTLEDVDVAVAQLVDALQNITQKLNT